MLILETEVHENKPYKKSFFGYGLVDHIQNAHKIFLKCFYI